ncbi:MAG: hypothetical protein EOS04_26835 [Mesorhizobium sp.]|nr:MAG: hypothetical protein EOR98_00375 [Mesorhizobium sp.]RWN74777.1 MAG: hypothetical protein EOS01_23740 [Mesorhizobium sp.]RWN80413.1 MAG: hypothetical protein EOS02_00375 [Mesorhizobium sp.]RWN84166.1 MAG: hypothetical protein EOS04_26835 [Mesorhizobium sp.]RWO10115.1 MAG: hypothetical protein EOS15_25725 [Mesorhizobium sp.]
MAALASGGQRRYLTKKAYRIGPKIDIDFPSARCVVSKCYSVPCASDWTPRRPDRRGRPGADR